MTRKYAVLRASLALALGVVALATRASDSPAKTGEKSVRVDSIVSIVADKGTFKILSAGKEAGREQFEITPSGRGWTIQGDVTIQTAKGPSHVQGTLELHSDGSPARYNWSTDGDKRANATVTFSGPSASIALNLSGTQPYSQQFSFQSQPIAVLDNNLYDQYAVLAGLYDWSKKGTQTFSVLVPQELTPGTVTVESLGKQDWNARSYDELRVKTDDLELDLYLDKGRLMRVASPGSDVEIIRD